MDGCYIEMETEHVTCAYSLEIERGHWHKPVIPEKDRTCRFCLNGQIESEKHSFSDCFLYTDLRNLFQSKILSVSPEVRALNKHEIFIALMQTTNIDL